MLIFDGHLDLAMNALEWNRDLNLSVYETRKAETGMTQKGRGRGTVAYPEMRSGGVGLCIATVLARVQKPGNPMPGYRTPEIAFAAAQGQLAYYRMLEEQGVLRLLTGWPALEAHVREWDAWLQSDHSALPTPHSPLEAPPIGMILTMEGADPVVYPEQVHRWKADGLRCIGLSHYGLSNYAYGTSLEGGLTEMGRAILPEVKAAGLVLDLTHLADQAFWEAIEAFDGPVQCSHQNCRAMVPGDRQMDDEQLRAVIQRGGVIGAALDAWMCYPGWVKGKTENTVCDLGSVADHIDHVCQLAGNARHAAIGSDLDGGYGQEQTPHDLDTIADLRKIGDLLRARGYSEQDVAGVMHGNLLRLFREAWAAGE
jgi:membrane dipeptidase